MTTTTRPLGAIATILDNDSLLAAGRRHFEAQYPGNDPQHLQHGPTPQMLFCTGHGNATIVNSEGVGNIADENDTIKVWFTYGYELLPVTLPLHEEIATTVTEERIDLAHGIRTFGIRLDSNHYRWFEQYDYDYVNN